MTTDQTGETPDTLKQIAVRLPLALVERIERHALRLRRDTGFLATRADAIRLLLDEAVSFAEQQEQKRVATTK